MKRLRFFRCRTLDTWKQASKINQPEVVKRSRNCCLDWHCFANISWKIGNPYNQQSESVLINIRKAIRIWHKCGNFVQPMAQGAVLKLMYNIKVILKRGERQMRRWVSTFYPKHKQLFSKEPTLNCWYNYVIHSLSEVRDISQMWPFDHLIQPAHRLLGFNNSSTK